jgi:hypothetical protein
VLVPVIAEISRVGVGFGKIMDLGCLRAGHGGGVERRFAVVAVAGIVGVGIVIAGAVVADSVAAGTVIAGAVDGVVSVAAAPAAALADREVLLPAHAISPENPYRGRRRGILDRVQDV